MMPSPELPALWVLVKGTPPPSLDGWMERGTKCVLLASSCLVQRLSPLLCPPSPPTDAEDRNLGRLCLCEGG